jgi:hypothetical protein
MDPKEKKNKELSTPRPALEEGSEAAPQLAPPSFMPTAGILPPHLGQMPMGTGPTLGPGPLNLSLSPQLMGPQYQLNPPQLGSNIDPDLMRRMALMDRLRNRTPLVGGLLSEEQILRLWHTPSDSTYEWDNGQSGRTWDLYGPEQMDEQIQIGEMLQQFYPIKPGWEWGVNGNGFGGTYNFENGNTLDLGVKPHSPEDYARHFPWMGEDENAPMFDGATLGATFRWK